EEGVEPYSEQLQGQTGIAVILKARENALVAVSFPRQGDHVERLNRFAQQYSLGLQPRDFARMFSRASPYCPSSAATCPNCPPCPFSARSCLSSDEWLACRLREEGIAFEQCANASTCATALPMNHTNSTRVAAGFICLVSSSSDGFGV